MTNLTRPISPIWPIAFLFLTHAAMAETFVGANGASGLGLVPKAEVLPRGTVVFDYSKAVIGHPQSDGFNYQIGTGLGEGLEINFRLAAQSNRCNFFAGECPPNSIRDLAGSFKYTLPYNPLQRFGISTAVGALDVGGAATNFRSYYITSTKRTEQFDFTIGAAQGQSAYSHLDGFFGAIEYRPVDWVKTGLQHLRGQTTAHAAVVGDVPFTPAQAYLGFHRSVTDSPVVPPQWFSFGLVIPMSSLENQKRAQESEPTRTVKIIALDKLKPALERQGFYDPHIDFRGNKALHVTVNNVAYSNNLLDAAGVALGVLAGLPKQDVEEVELVVEQRNIPLLRVVAPPACLRTWFEQSEPCAELKLTSAVHEAATPSSTKKPTRWWSGALRPELIIGPAAAYNIGTEIAAIDLQTAVVSNVVIPLWRGATWDVARIDPISNLRSREFEDGGFFSRDRYQARVTRRMFHQLWDIPLLNTVVRASYGTGFITWKGAHLETVTTSPGGTHRLGLITGRFEGPPPKDPFFGLPIFGAGPENRTYHLANYRYAWDAKKRMSTEVVAGRFWGQDEGAQILQRFWFGDANVGAYYRRSKMPTADKPTAFAGLLFTFPLTPRSTTGWKWAGVRGTNNFSLNVESKVGETDNRLTAGFGEIPRFGESPVAFMNQDRYSGDYFRTHAWRLRNAFRELTKD